MPRSVELLQAITAAVAQREDAFRRWESAQVALEGYRRALFEVAPDLFVVPGLADFPVAVGTPEPAPNMPEIMPEAAAEPGQNGEIYSDPIPPATVERQFVADLVERGFVEPEEAVGLAEPGYLGPEATAEDLDAAFGRAWGDPTPAADLEPRDVCDAHTLPAPWEDPPAEVPVSASEVSIAADPVDPGTVEVSASADPVVKQGEVSDPVAEPAEQPAAEPASPAPEGFVDCQTYGAMLGVSFGAIYGLIRNGVIHGDALHLGPPKMVRPDLADAQVAESGRFGSAVDTARSRVYARMAAQVARPVEPEPELEPVAEPEPVTVVEPASELPAVDPAPAPTPPSPPTAAPRAPLVSDVQVLAQLNDPAPMTAKNAAVELRRRDYSVMEQRNGWKVNGKLIATQELIDKAQAILDREERMRGLRARA
jgi:hypothetical protein